MNRLAESLSPYLRQHAENPVDWREWGEEAFAEARERDVPIFLSIGYATCHWCHVMAHESFEDDEVARLMNAAFVCVKLDREERPDVDHIYMAACQMVTGRGGWPLTALLTPAGEPFWVATYVPKASAHGRLGMLDLVPAISKAWSERRAEVEAAAERLAGALRAQNAAEVPALEVEATAPDTLAGWLGVAYEQLDKRFDDEYGGFGGGGARAPKFPTPHTLQLLLQGAHRKDLGRNRRARAETMATQTLDAMRAGGLFDHLGGGFHRYSTDRAWLLPHFEKMLYDQATLLRAYAEAFRLTGEARFAEVAREIVGYVRRDLRAPGGLYFSAEDADSLAPGGEHREGAFYVWTVDELREHLGESAAERFAEAYGAEARGNFADEATGQRTGENVLHLPRPLKETAEKLGMELSALHADLAASRARLLEARAQRPRPLLDDKILTDWNALYLGALARFAQALGGTDEGARYAEQAEKGLRALLNLMRRPHDEGGGLWHRARHTHGLGAPPEVGIAGMLDDYTFAAAACLDVYEATFDLAHLDEAIRLAGEIEARFAAGDGGYFLTEAGASDLIVRPREVYDGAIPSGMSAHALTLGRLYRMTGEARWQERADALFGYVARQTEHHPATLTAFLIAADFVTGEAAEVVIAGEASGSRALLAVAQRAPHRRRTLLLKSPGSAERLAEIAPFTAAMTAAPDGSTRAYVCQGFACDAPVEDAEVLARRLAQHPYSLA